MSAMACNALRCALLACATLAAPDYASAFAPSSVPQRAQGEHASVAPPVHLAAVTNAPPAQAGAQRYLLQVLVPDAPLHEKPDEESPIIGRVEQGVQLEA